MSWLCIVICKHSFHSAHIVIVYNNDIINILPYFIIDHNCLKLYSLLCA